MLSKTYRLQRARRRRRLKASIRDVAELMNVEASTVLRLENGRTANPSGPMLMAWDQALDLLEAERAADAQKPGRRTTVRTEE